MEGRKNGKRKRKDKERKGRIWKEGGINDERGNEREKEGKEKRKRRI